MKKYQFSVLLYLFLCNEIFYFAKCEFFTSIAELEKLLPIEELVIESLDKYIQEEEQRLGKVKWFSNQFENLHNLATEDEENFLANPVNAYLLVKRLIRDWNETSDLLQSDTKEIVNKVSNETVFPDVEDLSGSMTALLRLQYLYKLDTPDIASGHVKGVPALTELNAEDCYLLGLQAYANKDYEASVTWFEEAWHRFKKEEVKSANQREILEYLSYTSYLAENYTKAVQYAQETVLLDPYNDQAIMNLQSYQIQEAMNKGKKKEGKPLSEEMQDIVNKTIAYEKLCRGESVKTPAEESKLKCYYTSRNKNDKDPFKPLLKVEKLNLEPEILMFYDVLAEQEATALKNYAFPMLDRATVQEKTGKLVPANYRISKSTWLFEYMHPLVPIINQRVEEISGLNTFFAEPLHLINYGIGGMYEPHFDYIKKGGKANYLKRTGNRMATWIFYFTDVQAGGSTVFPRIGVEVKPKKGAAVFWHNLKPNGEGDERTMHAGCPVLAGSKWIGNKWLHERGNEAYFTERY